jgi:hypothetical protein
VRQREEVEAEGKTGARKKAGAALSPMLQKYATSGQ